MSMKIMAVIVLRADNKRFGRQMNRSNAVVTEILCFTIGHDIWLIHTWFFEFLFESTGVPGGVRVPGRVGMSGGVGVPGGVEVPGWVGVHL